MTAQRGHFEGDVIERWFTSADDSVSDAVVALRNLIRCYEAEKPPYYRARVDALRGKIALLQSVGLNPDAYPWTEDR